MDADWLTEFCKLADQIKETGDERAKQAEKAWELLVSAGIILDDSGPSVTFDEAIRQIQSATLGFPTKEPDYSVSVRGRLEHGAITTIAGGAGLTSQAAPATPRP